MVMNHNESALKPFNAIKVTTALTNIFEPHQHFQQLYAQPFYCFTRKLAATETPTSVTTAATKTITAIAATATIVAITEIFTRKLSQQSQLRTTHPKKHSH